MTFFAILALAVALAMDAFAVAVATGVRLGTVTRGQTFRLAFAFGLFQFLMPAAGWFMGLTVRDLIEAWDHWVAFALLAFVGLNMIREFLAERKEGPAGGTPACPTDPDAPLPPGTAGESCRAAAALSRPADPTRGFPLLMLSVATSIDALAVGLSFAMLRMSVWYPAAVIGVVCFLITAAGVFLGKSLARAEALSRNAELAGGLVLLAIGVKILWEHGVFGA